jgi:hypothetical protein
MEKTTVKGNPSGWEHARGLIDGKKKLHESKPHSFFNRIRKLALNKEESEQNYKIPALHVRLSIKQCDIFVYSVGGKLRLAKYLITPASIIIIIIIIIIHKASLKFWILHSLYLLFPFDLHEKYD